MPGQPDLRQVEDQGKSPDQHQKRADDRAPVAVTQHIDELQQDAAQEQKSGGQDGGYGNKTLLTTAVSVKMGAPIF